LQGYKHEVCSSIKHSQIGHKKLSPASNSNTLMHTYMHILFLVISWTISGRLSYNHHCY